MSQPENEDTNPMNEGIDTSLKAAFAAALDIKKKTAPRTALPPLLEEVIEAKTREEDVTLSDEEMIPLMKEAWQIGFDWTDLLLTRKPRSKTKHQLIERFTKLTSTIAVVQEPQAGSLFNTMVNGMEIENPAVFPTIRKLLLRQMAESPQLFQGLSSIPGARNISLQAYVITGFAEMSGYDTQRRQEYYHFLSEETEKEGKLYIGNHTLSWLRGGEIKTR